MMNKTNYIVIGLYFILGYFLNIIYRDYGLIYLINISVIIMYFHYLSLTKLNYLKDKFKEFENSSTIYIIYFCYFLYYIIYNTIIFFCIKYTIF